MSHSRPWTLGPTVPWVSWILLMYGVIRVSLIGMYWTEVRGTELMGSKARAFRLHG